MMKKQTKVICWLAGICCLLPAIVGLVLYSRLPDQVAVHWGFGGEPNGFMHKFGACFGIPLVTAALYGVLIAVTQKKSISARHAGDRLDFPSSVLGGKRCDLLHGHGHCASD